MPKQNILLTIVGDGSTGKSSIINGFKTDGFESVYKQTIGIEFYEKIMTLRNQHVSLTVWDIGGQSIFSSNLKQYLSSATIIFLNYDITSRDSFHNIHDWLGYVQKYCTQAQKIYLIGNKIDLIPQRLISEIEHDQFIISNTLSGGFFVSAKTGENLLKSFYQAVADCMKIVLTTEELESFQTVLKAHIVVDKKDDHNQRHSRTAIADEIEREDMEAERKKNRKRAVCVMA